MRKEEELGYSRLREGREDDKVLTTSSGASNRASSINGTDGVHRTVANFLGQKP